MSIPEARWDRTKTVFVRVVEGLHGYRNVNRISFSYADFYLNGQLLTVGGGGINAGEGISNIWGQGVTTAEGDTLIFHPNSGADNALRIEGQIDDNSKGKVGILVKNLNPKYDIPGIIRISGAYDNHFTGDVVVEGRASHLYLGKVRGALAVGSNIYARNGGVVGIEITGQIADSSKVTLQGKGSAFMLNDVSYALNEKFRSLVVEGEGHVLFNRNATNRYGKTLIIDDLLVAEGSTLSVDGWDAALDLFLVKKEAKNVDALKRIYFTGQNQNIVELINYDRDYWKLYASPEPTTYGAILGVVGLGLAIWRKRRRSGCNLLEDSRCFGEGL